MNNIHTLIIASPPIICFHIDRSTTRSGCLEVTFPNLSGVINLLLFAFIIWIPEYQQTSIGSGCWGVGNRVLMLSKDYSAFDHLWHASLETISVTIFIGEQGCWASLRYHFFILRLNRRHNHFNPWINAKLGARFWWGSVICLLVFGWRYCCVFSTNYIENFW